MVLRSDLLSAESEIKSNKDDAEAKAKQISWLEEQLTKAQEQIATTRKEAAQLRTDHGGMVQRSELDALQTELNELHRTLQSENKRHRENVQALNEKFSSVDSERAEHVYKMQVSVPKLTRLCVQFGSLAFFVKCVLQGMVDRAELLAALSEIKVQREDAQSKTKDLEWAEAQLVKAREQLELARLSEAQLRAEMSSMVAKSELEASKAHLHEVEIAASEENQNLREATLRLKSSLCKLEQEKSALEVTMQVSTVFHYKFPHSRAK